MDAKKNFVLSVVLAIAVIVMAMPMAGCDSKFIPSAADKKTLQDLPAGFLELSQAWQKIQEYYVERGKLDPVKMAQGAIRGMVEAVGDPYTEYYSPQSYQSTMAGLTGLYQGIGAYIGKKDNQLVIIAPMPGSPAENAGIKSGDMIPIMQVGPGRHKSLPTIPLGTELPNLSPNGKALMSFVNHQAVFNRVFAAPPGIPPARLKFLRNAVMRSLTDPELIAIGEKQQKPVDPADAAAVTNAVNEDLQMAPQLKDLIKKSIYKYVKQ